jgi:hypothetical protein
MSEPTSPADERRLDGTVGRHPTLSECEAAGKGPSNGLGAPYSSGGVRDTSEERERFEAYMQGHCWSIGNYDGAARGYDTVFVRCLYGVWRDRGSLPTVTPNVKGEPNTTASTK